MTTNNSKTGAGLRGQSAGETALCTVGKTGSGLTYRGYDMVELAENASFEEVAYLLLYGKLPNQSELDKYIPEDNPRKWAKLSSDIDFRRLELTLLKEILIELRQINAK